MPGEYRDIGGAPPQLTTLLTVVNGEGPPFEVTNTAAFPNVPMGQRRGGPIAGAGAGVRTEHRSDCVVIAVLQRNAGGAWTHYFFAHLNGGIWSAADQQVFNAAITDPVNAFVAMNSNAFAGMLSLLDDMNAGNPAGAIPVANMLQYVSGDPTFALRFADGAVGQAR